MRQVFRFQIATALWQNTTVITKCEDFITKCDIITKSMDTSAKP